MLIVLSPAKKLDFEKESPYQDFTLPAHLEKAKLLIKDLKKLKYEDLKSLMKLSDNLIELNLNRYRSFKFPFDQNNAKQALYAFQGDTYVGFQADTIKKASLNYAQKHLLILSGLYGVLKPLDLIQPYRLEMGTKFPTNGCNNLYEFWKQTITDDVNEVLSKEKYLINCASNEYFSSIDKKSLKGEIITPQFKEKKNGTYKMIGFFAKKARGMMARYLIDNKIKEPVGLQSFNLDGYKFNSKLSKLNSPVFTRS